MSEDGDNVFSPLSFLESVQRHGHTVGAQYLLINGTGRFSLKGGGSMTVSGSLV